MHEKIFPLPKNTACTRMILIKMITVSHNYYFSITGYAGIIGSFLSFDLFAPLSRLTYCMYLIHIHVLFEFHSRLKEAWRFDKYLIVSEIFMGLDVIIDECDFLCTSFFLKSLFFIGSVHKICYKKYA